MRIPGIRTALSFLGFPLAGLAAALLTICVPMTRILSGLNPLGSLCFAVAMALCMWLFSGLRSIRKTVIFLLGSFVAAVAAMLSAVYVTGTVFEPGPSEQIVTAPIAFTGGFVGALVLMAAALACFSDRSLRVLALSACWALVGGGLAVCGYSSEHWFELTRSRFRDFGPGRTLNGLNTWRGEELALMIIWQTGMALVIALAVWMEQKSAAIQKPTASAKTA